MGSELRIELKSIHFVTLCYCCLFNFPQHTFFSTSRKKVLSRNGPFCGPFLDKIYLIHYNKVIKLIVCGLFLDNVFLSAFDILSGPLHCFFA